MIWVIRHFDHVGSPISSIFYGPEAGWVFEETLLNGIIELDYEDQDDLKLFLTSDVLNPLTLSSARAGEIEWMWMISEQNENYIFILHTTRKVTSLINSLLFLLGYDALFNDTTLT